jgi:LmbE family N-acetylglucosaminyl deacetylase
MSPEIRLHHGRPERLLVIVAHPGDAEREVGGSVARWVSQGTVAQLVCLTSGDAGSDDADADPLELAARREREQRAAADIVGYEDVTFLHRPDGALANDLALREQLVRVIRTFRPDAVAAGDPRVFIDGRGFVNHVDHREAGAAALDAVQPAAARAMTFPHLVSSEGLVPHCVERLVLFGTDRPTAVVDISGTQALKSRAIRAHASQAGRPEHQDVRITERARQEGERAGVAAAESLAIIDLR